MVGVDIGLLGGRYRLVERIGTGGMSVVWRGFDEVLGRQVAVKVLAAKLASDRTFRRRIRTEAQAAARLVHPHITNVYDYGESVQGGVTVPYVVMELVEGISLAQRLADGQALTWPEAVTVCAEVAAALAAAHARGVVHRDVTPSNVMLTAGGAKVVDFGISALVGESEAGPDGSLLGTPAYLAPERLDLSQVSPAADVYGLGLLLYRALTGRLPWEARTKTEMIRAHLYTEPVPVPPIDGLPPELADLCRRCLAKTPGKRPTSAEVAAALAAAVGLPPAFPVSPAPGGGCPAPVADPGTTILPWSTETGALPWSSARQPPPGPRRPVRRRLVSAASLGVVLGAAGTVWATTFNEPTDAMGAVAAGPAAVAAAPALTCAVGYAVTSDTGKAFGARLTILNGGPSAAHDWSLSFRLPGDQRVTRAAGARYQQNGDTVVVRPTGAATTIAAGQWVTVDLAGSYVRSNAFPHAFWLGETACEPRISGISDAVRPATTAAARPVRKPASPAKPKTSADEDHKGKGGGGKGSGTN
ncbi:MAG TPA: serine/threonine-protein kinase [Asanoa sp.]